MAIRVTDLTVQAGWGQVYLELITHGDNIRHHHVQGAFWNNTTCYNWAGGRGGGIQQCVVLYWVHHSVCLMDKQHWNKHKWTKKGTWTVDYFKEKQSRDPDSKTHTRNFQRTLTDSVELLRSESLMGPQAQNLSLNRLPASLMTNSSQLSFSSQVQQICLMSHDWFLCVCVTVC